MCGIAAAVGLDTDELRRALAAMTDQMVRRGPDDGGVDLFCDGRESAGLGNRRLAIIDPSASGHQPMRDPDRGTAIAYNGMLYNFRELRARLTAEGERFMSNCDTEVVLKAYGRYGFGCVHRLRGMFAFAVWDPRTETLFLARDRLGIKPLYYARSGRALVAASAVKAIIASGLVPPRLSPEGIASYLALGAPADPLTAIDGILSMPPGHTATFRSGRVELTQYWEPPSAAPDWRKNDTEEELRALLSDAVRTHLVSDAPLGVFLSGGADSSIVTALATSHAADVRTLSVLFDDPKFSEARYVDIAVQDLRPRHRAITLRPSELAGWLDDAFTGMDQPSFDALNTYVVARLAHEEGLKVALSGLGADELFDGYRYAPRVTRLEAAARLPQPLRRMIATVGAHARPGAPAEKLSAWLVGQFTGPAHALLRTLYLPGDVQRLLRPELSDSALFDEPRGDDADRRHALAVAELSTYLRNVLLRDTDAMAMANSVEVRVPFLDHPLVEYVLGLPPSARVGGKQLLFDAARGLLPNELFTRRKRGFALPLSRWMQNELRAEVTERITHQPAALAEVLDPGVSRAIWSSYLDSGRAWLRPWSLYALGRWTASLDEIGRPSAALAGPAVVVE